MMRAVTAMVAVLAVLPGAGALAQPSPFPEIPLPPPAPRSHLWAYASFAAGTGLMASSFVFASRANHAYDDYLAAFEPAEIERLYDKTVLNDRLSSATLLTGEVLIATGLYLRFLRPSPESRLTLHVGSERCALAWRF